MFIFFPALWAALFSLIWKKKKKKEILGIVDWVIPYGILTVGAFCKVAAFLIVLVCCAYRHVQYLGWAGLHLAAHCTSDWIFPAFSVPFFQASMWPGSSSDVALLQNYPILLYTKIPGSLLPRSHMGLSWMISAWVSACCSWSWA